MGNILREPLPGEYEASTMARFAEFVGMPGASYAELRQWSIADIEAFWGHFERFLGVRWHDRPECVLKSREMPGAEWFPGGTLSFVEHIFAGRDPQKTALISGDGSRDLEYWSWGDLRRRTAALRAGLQAYGVEKGDRVAAYMPNIHDTMAAFFAVASLGAVWTAIAPEFGFETAVSRLSQVEPKVLLGVDGYRHKGKSIEREDVGREIAEAIGARYVRFGYLDGSGWPEDFASPSATDDELDFEIVAFDHPLWIVYSSGTTGKPKAIVHGHGGALLELGKIGVLQMGLGDSDRHFWYTSSGWIMWNNQLAATLAGSALVLFDEFPDPDAVWRVVSDSKTTVFGAGAAWYEGARRQGWKPAPDMDFSALKAVGSTGSPLPGACYDWIYEILPRSVWLVSVCGGTDVIISLMGLAPGTPVFRGELGGPTLGVDLQSWDENGVAHVGRAGELVLTQPIPSMPLFFWNDESGEKLRDAYYAKFPGIYGHGDRVTVTERDTVIVEGRSDATLNRRGVRIGSGEIYSALGEVEGIVDSVVVDVPVEGRDSRLVLLVVLAPSRELDDEFVARTRSVLREKCSPYHIPDDVFAVSELPRTLSNKKLEVPIKRILAGAEESDVVSRNSLANPGSLDEIVELARRLRSAA